MFIRLGLEDESRPVAVLAWPNEVCTAAERIHQLRQRVDVGRLQLGQLPVLEDRGDDFVLVPQRLERVCVGRVAGLRALADGKPEVFEEDLGELLRRVQVEFLAGQLLDLGFEGGELAAQLVLHVLQVGHVDRDALRLHVGQHAGERQLDLVEEVVDAEVAHLGFESRPQVEDRLGPARGELRSLVFGNRRRLARRAPRAEKLLAADELQVQELPREVLQPRVTRPRAQ